MSIDEIIKKIKNTSGGAAGNLAKYFYKNPKDLEKITKITNFLSFDASLRNRFYYIRNDLFTIKICKYCNKKLNNPFNNFCSKKCNINYQIENTDFVERRSKTISKNYHKKTDEDKEKIKEKRRKTNIKKYGVDNNLNIPEVKKKKIQTWINNYGVDNPSRAQAVKDKRRKTNIEKYGGQHLFMEKSKEL